MTEDEQGGVSERFARGDKARREVLGDRYVNSMLTDWPTAQPLLQLITEYPWGFLWTRDTLDRKQRSLVTIGILAALGRRDELALHVRGAINNGCTPEQMVEAALHSAVYGGVPSGIEAVKVIRACVQEQE